MMTLLAAFAMSALALSPATAASADEITSLLPRRSDMIYRFKYYVTPSQHAVPAHAAAESFYGQDG